MKQALPADPLALDVEISHRAIQTNWNGSDSVDPGISLSDIKWILFYSTALLE
jgi:hypothetical protein